MKRTDPKQKQKKLTPAAAPKKPASKKNASSSAKTAKSSGRNAGAKHPPGKTAAGKKEKASHIPAYPFRAQKKRKTPEPPSFEKYPAVHPEPPEELENEMLLIAVDPDVIYASWAIRTEDFPEKWDAVILRVCDVTGADDSSPHIRALITAPVRKRIGVEFLDVKLSGKDVIVEIGTLDATGRFSPIVRSNRVSIPESRYSDESGAFLRMPGTDTPYGY